MAAGLRVIRGPDWNLDDDDGGEGHVGTVVEVGEDGNTEIVWDGGQITVCRGGQGEGHDLRVLDNATVGIRHPTIICDECGESGIVGIRWKCVQCFEVDLCTLCYFSDEHNCSHQFWRFETPNSVPEKVERRNKSMKMRVLGIFPEATVARGKDWEWNDQDGGKGSTGIVRKLLTPAVNSARSAVQVEWKNGRKDDYRVGYKGKMDLRFIEEAPGLECYPKHLPVYEADHYSQDKLSEIRVSDSMTVGDNVIIKVGVSELQQLQASHGGWTVGMVECIGQVGKVKGFATNGDAIVSFGNKKYRLDPGALKKVGSIRVGSHVRILDDEEKVSLLQDGHGGYNNRMRVCLGKVGEVIKVDKEGDIVVKFGDRIWVFAPTCCVAAPEAKIDYISSRNVRGGETIKIRLGFNQDRDDLLRLLRTEDTDQPSDELFLKAIADREEEEALDMLRKEPKLVKADAQGFTALHVASNRGLLRITAALVESGADLNCKDEEGDTPLLAALVGGNAEVSEYLIKTGCDVNARNNDGLTASHMAAIAGYSQVLQALMTRGADFNVQDVQGDTPLHHAIAKSQVAEAKVILSWPQIDLHRANEKGFPPLHLACLKDEREIVECIIRRDRTIVNKKKDNGFTPLHVCACKNHTQVMEILLEKGNATVDETNNSWQTPLHTASYEAAFDCIQLLVKHGADVNGRDNLGNTPLHLTMMLGEPWKEKETCTKIACFLIEHHADSDAMNDDGRTALDLCSSEKMKETVQRFIQDKGSKKSAGPSTQTTSPGAMSVNAENLCKVCRLREAEILLTRSGHQPLCKECCSYMLKYPQCEMITKNLYNKDGKKLKEGCIVM